VVHGVKVTLPQTSETGAGQEQKNIAAHATPQIIYRMHSLLAPPEQLYPKLIHNPHDANLSNLFTGSDLSAGVARLWVRVSTCLRASSPA
jgi:hypothetical protein